MPNNDRTKATSEALIAKKPFIPKRRTPYLMQEEAIKHKEEASSAQNDENIKDSPFSAYDDTLNKGGQLVVNKESIGSPYINIEKHNTPLPTKIKVNTGSDSNVINKEINYHEEVGRLYGIQKKLAQFFVQSCIQRNQNKTGPVTAETLCHITGSTKKTIKKIIQRMIEKKIISRTEGKRGKGGFAIYILDNDFINIVRLQQELELDHAAINAKFSSINPMPVNNNRVLPESWENIDLTGLTEVFKNLKTKNTQFFGKQQLKVIYNSGNKLTFEDVQNSVYAFTYGIKNLLDEEPYKSMQNPAAILFETLKNGDKWQEKKFLSIEEDTIYKIYVNLVKKFNEEVKSHFKKWIAIDREIKFDSYKSTMGSTQFYNDRVFEEKAWEDFEKNIWSNERDKMILDIIGVSNKVVVDKIKLLVVN